MRFRLSVTLDSFTVLARVCWVAEEHDQWTAADIDVPIFGLRATGAKQQLDSRNSELSTAGSEPVEPRLI
jgi:hypothetical protein